MGKEKDKEPDPERWNRVATLATLAKTAAADYRAAWPGAGADRFRVLDDAIRFLAAPDPAGRGTKAGGKRNILAAVLAARLVQAGDDAIGAAGAAAYRIPQAVARAVGVAGRSHLAAAGHADADLAPEFAAAVRDLGTASRGR